jgi:hypothetical protein
MFTSRVVRAALEVMERTAPELEMTWALIVTVREHRNSIPERINLFG